MVRRRTNVVVSVSLATPIYHYFSSGSHISNIKSTGWGVFIHVRPEVRTCDVKRPIRRQSKAHCVRREDPLTRDGCMLQSVGFLHKER
jgi:hypothetical protein